MSDVFAFCHFYFNFFSDHLVYLYCLRGLSFLVSFACVFLGQMSDFLNSDCVKRGYIPFVFFFFSWKRATSSAIFKFVTISTSAMAPSEMCTLKTSSIIAVGESGSPWLTPLFIVNSSDINLSKWTFL